MTSRTQSAADLVVTLARTICRADNIDPDANYYRFDSGEKEILQRWQLYVPHAKAVIRTLETEGHLAPAHKDQEPPRA